MSPRPSASGTVRAMLAGDRRALARLITAVENREASAVPALREVYKRTGKARIIGITGPLGVGKSSLINELLQLLRSKGLTIGVVAVDPSSPFSGGSVLGDRVRIDRREGDDGIFLRSMASRGHTGGVAAATREVCRLLDAFGMDVVLVETVGSGQVDVEIRDIASTSVVVLVPHLGDEVQSLKAGLFEIADVFCVNKADLAGADLAAKDLNDLASLGSASDGWRPAVVTTSTSTHQGLGDLWSAIDAHEKFLDTQHLRGAGERRRLAHELVGLVTDRVGRELKSALAGDSELTELLDDLVARKTDPYEAAERLYRDSRPRG